MNSLPRFYPAMDVMRYILAFGVVVAHFNELFGASLPYPVMSYESVGGFFAISGFLMYPSFLKHKGLRRYIAGRAARILPPYFFIVVLCAIGLVFVSSFKADEYFANRGFWSYLAANITFLNWLHPCLPGVFADDAYMSAAVNGSLWTMKVEWSLYLSVPVFAWLIAKSKMKPGVLAIVCVVLSMLYRLGFTYLGDGGPAIFSILARQVFGQMSYFYLGIIIYFYREAFCRRLWLWIVLGIGLMLLSRHMVYASLVINPVGVSLAVLGLSLLPVSIPFGRHYNLSYDIYLFHYPLIQLSVFFGLRQWGIAPAFIAVLAAVVFLSVISAKFVDRRFLKRRC